MSRTDPATYTAPTDELVANILATWSSATDAERADGATWYDRAHRIATELTPADVSVGAAVIAATSPQVSWSTNVAIARRIVRDREYHGTFGSNLSKARRIFELGETADSVLGGPKVRAFWQLIADPSDTFSVVVDRHAVALALGRTLTDRERKVLERVGCYDHVADAYRRAAKVLELPAHVVQATTWLAWRRLTNVWQRHTDNIDQGELF